MDTYHYSSFKSFPLDGASIFAIVVLIFQNDLAPATSVDEIVDVCGLLEDIPSPASFLLEVLAMVP